MKAKKISMIISVSLFLLGLSFAFIFNFANVVHSNWQQLLINLSIGISTGGLVAVLIEIPMMHSLLNSNKQNLIDNSLRMYASGLHLTALIDEYCDDENQIVFGNFGEPMIKSMVQFATPLATIDSHMYFSKTKQMAIEFYIDDINRLLLETNLNRRIESKTLILQTKRTVTREEKMEDIHEKDEIDSCDELVFSVDVLRELLKMRHDIDTLFDMMFNTMNLILSKKDNKKWHSRAMSIERENQKIRKIYEKSNKE